MRKKNTPMHVVWFKRDLRVADHRPLAHAAACGAVLPLLIVEPEWWQGPDMSARQFGFYRECAVELTNALAALGQPLVVRTGDAVRIFEDVHRDIGIAGLWSHEETGNDWTFRRDLRVADWCRRRGIPWTEFRQDGVIRRLKNRDGWSRKWDGLMAEPVTAPPAALAPVPCESEPMPTSAGLGLACDAPPLRQRGGRAHALSTVSSFLEARGETYRAAMSSPVTGERACSRLSPYLAWGALSMREAAQATWRQQRALKQAGKQAGQHAMPVGRWRAALVSFTGRLHWHCHFMQKLEDEPRLEFQNLHRAYDGLRTESQSDAVRLAAWRAGETGLPFVDACMRYLAATGWLNFRMRAMLMAVASYHLWLHWREPGLHLARLFTDYEPGIHWPQTQMQSGTTGINTVRIYNPIKQGCDQDPDGAFVRRWVPELASVEGCAVHEPWKSPHAGRLLDRVYPMPIVDHMQAARDARQKIYAARKAAGFRDAAKAIQMKHGSRKSGAGQRTRSRRTAQPDASDQLSMALEPSARNGRGIEP